MCIALQRTNPSLTPLFNTRSSTVSVMLTNPRRPFTSNQRYSVSDFILTFIVPKLVSKIVNNFVGGYDLPPPSAYCPREDARRVSFLGSSLAFRLSREIAPARHV